MTKTILHTYGLDPVKAWTSSKAVALDAPAPNLLYGVELEIENTMDFRATSGWRAVEDGSLRNGGMEYVSSPMTYSNMVWALNTFFANNKAVTRTNDDGSDHLESNYSERTSIHVHINCQDITIMQLATLCMIYEAFERLLFGFIGNNRDKNIFCVPWYETNLSYQTVESLARGDVIKIRKWQKYTALNLLPLQTKGTIEFRHMHGNSDIALITKWLRLIGRMYAAATNLSFEEMSNILVNLNTTSAYDRTLEMVFREDADALRVPGYELDLEQGVLDMKYTMMAPNKAVAKQPAAREWGFPLPGGDVNFNDIRRRERQVRDDMRRLQDGIAAAARQLAPEAVIMGDLQAANPAADIRWVHMDNEGNLR